GQHPAKTLAHVLRVQARQFARVGVNAVDGQLPGAFAGRQQEPAVRLDVERARRLLRRRLPQGRELAGAVDGESGQAVVTAVRDPDEPAARVYVPPAVLFAPLKSVGKVESVCTGFSPAAGSKR